MKEFQNRIHQKGYQLEWADVIRDLNRLEQIEIEQEGKRFLLRANATGSCGKVFQAVRDIAADDSSGIVKSSGVASCTISIHKESGMWCQPLVRSSNMLFWLNFFPATVEDESR